jgi:hypothetical protein
VFSKFFNLDGTGAFPSGYFRDTHFVSRCRELCYKLDSKHWMRKDSTAAADLWRNTLAQIPTVFGRLWYLSSLRDQNTGIYQHFGLAQRFDPEEANRVLRQSHLKVFEQWLCFSLEQQKNETDEYLQTQEGDPKVIISNWLRLSPYRNCIPVGTREVERRLFMSDLKVVLELLRTEYSVASPDPEA